MTTAIALTSLRRYLRDRTAMFFVVLLPVLLILLVGTTVGGFDTFDVAVVDHDGGPLADELVDALDRASAVDLRRVDSEDAATTAVRRGEVVVAVVVPAGYDEALRRGEPQELTVIADLADTAQQAALSAVSAVVSDQAVRLQAAQLTAARTDLSMDDAMALAAETAATVAPVEVLERSVERGSDVLPPGYSYSAPTMLVLFVFINAVAGSTAIIETRRLGIYERVLAAPVPARTVVAGETLAYLSMAVLQSAIVVGVGALLFDVDWGDPLAAGLLVAVWALLATGAGVLGGTLFRTAEQAGSVGPAVGIAFGMLGGCMWPLEIVPPIMQRIGHLVPHGWAVDAWTALLSRDADVRGVATELLVLAGFALVLLVLATARLRRRLAA